MSILTLDFFIFTFIVLVLYYIAPRKYRFMVLFLASLYFYLDKTPWYQQVAFAVFLIFNYLASMAFVFVRKDDVDRRKEFLIFLVLSLIGLLLNTFLLWLYVDVLAGKVNWIYSVHDVIYSWLVSINVTFFADLSEFIEIMAKIFATAIVMVYNFISRKMTLEKKD